MSVDRPRLLETLAKLSVCLADGDFDLLVFGGVFKIALAVDCAYRGAIPPDGWGRLFLPLAKPSRNSKTIKGSAGNGQATFLSRS
ncbi:MAG: hypothetical protein GWP33_00480 [Alphaproteobacteria bacterium]|nr:hypothetical protein [Alphaproteobacteria bacterium]